VSSMAGSRPPGIALLALLLAAIMFATATLLPSPAFVVTGTLQQMRLRTPAAPTRQVGSEPTVSLALRSLGSVLFLGGLAAATRVRTSSSVRLAGSKIKVIVQPRQIPQQSVLSTGVAVHSLIVGDLINLETDAADCLDICHMSQEVPGPPQLSEWPTQPSLATDTDHKASTFGHTTPTFLAARVAGGARQRSARRAFGTSHAGQAKQRRRIGARLRALSVPCEPSSVDSFDASRLRIPIQIGLSTSPRPRAAKARRQPIKESAERLVGAAELLRASYMCEDRDIMDMLSFAL